MSLWSRVANVLRPDRLNREIDEELESHIEEAVADGRDPVEARRALGSPLRLREESRDVRLLGWLDALCADAVYGLRRLTARKVTSAAAILSLALAIGACMSAFRLVDALLLRPLPVSTPNRLYALSREGIGFDGKFEADDAWAYPAFRLMRVAVKDDGELLAVSYVEQTDVRYTSAPEIEKVQRQYVSGWMFTAFGLRPAAGRLLTEQDDLVPRTHPYAVLSYDYWTRRFGRDPSVVGRTFRMGTDLYEIVGVAGEGFTGTEPGTMTDVFVPTMMNDGVSNSDQTWFRTLALIAPDVAVGPLRERLGAISRAFETERAKGFTDVPEQSIANHLNQTVLLEPAPSGVSGLQADYRRALAALGVLVALVLLIASANVANLMTAEGAARAREMALRVAIGAGRLRLVQLVLVEGAWIAGIAASLGVVFAWWSAPVVVGMINPPSNPARLALPWDWRVAAFCFALTLGVTVLFGLMPALRASGVRPASALKSGATARGRRRLMHGLVALQIAFCFLVLLVAGLFVATFDRLSTRPTGFSADRVLTLDTVADRDQPPLAWDQVAERLRTVPGVERVALAQWPLLGGSSSNGFISVDGAPPGEVPAYFLGVSPGWIDAMQIPLVEGRDLVASDRAPGVALVNEAFAKQFFAGVTPIGRSFERTGDTPRRYRIVGVVRDARYRSPREAALPTAYMPFHAVDPAGAPRGTSDGTIIVRTTVADPLALAPVLRQEMTRVWPELSVSTIRSQTAINASHMVRERMLAVLASFFATVAVLLAGVGLYGVLHYAVVERRREIGIRIAVGARSGDVARLVMAEVAVMVVAGAGAGLVVGVMSVRSIEALFYDVSASDPGMLALPLLAILATAILAAVPPVIEALRLNPVTLLRAE